jgi:hypothetical protein
MEWKHRVNRFTAIPAALMAHQVGNGDLIQSRIDLAAFGQVGFVRQQFEHAVIEF